MTSASDWIAVLFVAAVWCWAGWHMRPWWEARKARKLAREAAEAFAAFIQQVQTEALARCTCPQCTERRRLEARN